MTRKRIVQLAALVLMVLAVSLSGSIGCSGDKKATDTTPNTIQTDTPLLTASEAQSLVYQYLDFRLVAGTYRTRLTAWGGRTGGSYAGNHKWNVIAGTLGTWSLQERTETVTPSNALAQNITRLYFK